MNCRKLTIKEHNQLGLLLEMTRLYNMISMDSYKTKAKQNKSLENRIVKMVDKLKNELDNQVVKQYHESKFDTKQELISIYYSKSKEAEKILGGN